MKRNLRVAEKIDACRRLAGHIAADPYGVMGRAPAAKHNDEKPGPLFGWAVVLDRGAKPRAILSESSHDLGGRENQARTGKGRGGKEVSRRGRLA